MNTAHPDNPSDIAGVVPVDMPGEALADASSNGSGSRADSPEDEGWRVDELAQRAGVTVDTIRFYRREGLLDAGTRVGRTRRFGPDHMRRLERIHHLRERRFSLAAIRALLDASESGEIAGLFDDDGPNGGGITRIFDDGGSQVYAFEELCERASLDADLALRLLAAGVPKDPALVGRDGYDSRDLDAVRALAELADLGVPDDLLVAMAGVWCDGLARMQAEIVHLFADLGSDQRGAVREAVARRAPDLLPVSSRLVAYVHVRTMQQLMLAAVGETATVDTAAVDTDTLGS